MKHFITILCSLLFAANMMAQEANKDVTITASGSGSTLEDAKQSALRSATEQAFGAFISSKTEIFNDQVVADQMSSVSSGNIKSYEVLNEDQLPDGRYGVTLKAIVSVDKLSSFVQAKGVEIEIKGGLFALNIKQQLLNEQGEIEAVYAMVGLLHEPMQTAFDYTIKSSEPKSLDAESKNWEIPLEVTATCNKNMDFCANYFIKTLRALSLSAEEVASYKALNKKVFTMSVSLTYIQHTVETSESVYDICNKYGISREEFQKINGYRLNPGQILYIPARIDERENIYLRKERSIDAINSFLANWNGYTRLFAVQSGLDESFGNGQGRLLMLDGNKSFDEGMDESFGNGQGRLLIIDGNKSFDEGNTIYFPSSGNVAGIFTWNDKRTLSQIEQMTGYAVKPRGVISNFKNGGYVVWEKDGHGLVAAICDIGGHRLGSTDAKLSCEDLVMSGYSDWYLPSKDHLQYLYENLHHAGFGGFQRALYWSSSSAESEWTSKKVFDFDYNGPGHSLYYQIYVRAVRSF